METHRTLVTPTQKSPITIDRIRPGEIEAAARILGRGFVHERFFGYLFEGTDEATMVQAMQPWFRGWLRSFAPHGEVHTARLDGELVGVAIRMAPGVYPPSGLAKVAFMARMIRGVARMGLSSRRAFKVLGAASMFEKLEPKQPFWHLAWIGVDPDHHHSGIGSALADEAVRMADTQPAPAWLLTFGPHTRRIYEQRGFVVENDIRPIPGGPSGWTMRRDPTTA